MPKSKSMGLRSQSLYKEDLATQRGIPPASEEHHRPGRDAETGLLFKLPGHPTLAFSVKEDQVMGYRTIGVGEGMASYPAGDPRITAGSVSAPRRRDISADVAPSEKLYEMERRKAK